jgi:predicted nucleotidyltransferase
MQALSEQQRALITTLVAKLSGVSGIAAIVLGGSHARGQARPESDIDLGVLYSDATPFDISELRSLLEGLNDTPAPTITGFYEWGRWVNGGAWLTIEGQRVDVLYRSIEHLQRVIDEAHAGHYEVDYLQQPPFGFFSATYLGEVAICQPLWDPQGIVTKLQARVTEYPAKLQQRIVQEQLWSAEFALQAFAAKFAARADTYGTVGCLTRAVNHLVLVLFALNGRYLLNDKTALLEISGFERCPVAFAARVQRALAHPGASAADLAAATEEIVRLTRETRELAELLYQPKYVLP